MTELTLSDTQSLDFDTQCSQPPQAGTRDLASTKQEIDQLAVQIQDIHHRAARAHQQTIVLKGGIRAAFNLSYDLEVWEQIPIDQQIEFGNLDSAIKWNDFFLEFLKPMIESLPGLLEMEDFGMVEGKMWLIMDYLPMTEGNVVMVTRKLEERALTKGVDEMTL
jgi:hypothetical protein